MAARLSRLPVLLFVFLAVHVPASHAIPPPLPATYDGSICSESVMCGDVNISYPFYLADATNDYGYSYSCGYTDLKISCQGEGPNKSPVISLGSEKYTVQNIFYDIHTTIILADSDVFVDGNCPAVRHNVTFEETWLHESSNDNLTFFFGCHLGDSMMLEFDAYKIKCADFKSPPDAGPGDSFVLVTDEHDRYLVQELDTNCRKIVTVPVRDPVLMEARYQNNFTRGGYGDVLKRGFELEWIRITANDQCHLCEESEGKCAYSPYREFVGCLCHEGKMGSPDCKHIVSPSTAPAPAPKPSKSF